MNKYHICLYFFTFLFWISCSQNNGDATQNMDDGGEQAAVTVLAEHPVKKQFSGKMEITGNIESNRMASIHAMVSGYVKRIEKNIGDRVAKGQTLAVLENPEITIAWENAKSQLRVAESEKDVAIAKLDAKQKMFEKLKSVYDKTPGLISEMEYITAETERQTAEATVKLRQSKIDVANAVLKNATLRKNLLAVKAPFSGIISARHVDEGAFIQNALVDSDAQSLFDLVDVNSLRLVIWYPETDLAFLSKGTPVEISFPEIPGYTLNKNLSRISSSLNPTSKTVRAEVDLSDVNKEIKPGMFAHVVTTRARTSPSLAISTQALVTQKNAYFVYVVSDGIVKKTSVRLGLEDKTQIEVVSGELTEKDLVVVRGKGLINEGMNVNVKTN